MNKVKQDYNDMAAVVDSVEIKGATRYEKVKFIHDFICKRVEYDESLKYLPHMSLRAYFCHRTRPCVRVTASRLKSSATKPEYRA